MTKKEQDIPEEIEEDLEEHFERDEKLEKEGNEKWTSAAKAQRLILKKLTRMERNLLSKPDISPVANPQIEVPIPKPPAQEPQKENEAVPIEAPKQEPRKSLLSRILH